MALRVLAVDDSEQMQRAVKRMLKRACGGRAITIETASRAQEAFDLIVASPTDQWFVTTDRAMPSKSGDVLTSGDDLVRALRAHPVRIDVTLVIVSGEDRDEELARLAHASLAKTDAPVELPPIFKTWLG